MTVETIGRSAIQKVENVGGLSLQFTRGLLATLRLNPFLSKSRLRWKTAIRQMAGHAAFRASRAACHRCHSSEASATGGSAATKDVWVLGLKTIISF